MTRVLRRPRGYTLVNRGYIIAIRRCIYLGLFGSSLLLIFYTVLVSQTDVDYDYNEHLVDGNVGERVKAPVIKEISTSPMWLVNRYPRHAEQNSTRAATNAHMVDRVLISDVLSSSGSYPRVIPYILHQTWDDVKVPGQVSFLTDHIFTDSEIFLWES